MCPTNPTQSPHLIDEEARWRAREQEWSRRLKRIYLGEEPVEIQLDRHRRLTWALTIVPSVIGLMFVSLFTVFGRIDIGLVVVSLLLVPIITISWMDYFRLSQNVSRFLAERERHESERTRAEP